MACFVCLPINRSVHPGNQTSPAETDPIQHSGRTRRPGKASPSAHPHTLGSCGSDTCLCQRCGPMIQAMELKQPSGLSHGRSPRTVSRRRTLVPVRRLAYHRADKVPSPTPGSTPPSAPACSPHVRLRRCSKDRIRSRPPHAGHLRQFRRSFPPVRALRRPASCPMPSPTIFSSDVRASASATADGEPTVASPPAAVLSTPVFTA